MLITFYHLLLFGNQSIKITARTKVKSINQNNCTHEGADIV
jgi:hypothetical protein